MASESLHPVRVVVGRTGLSAHVLRAWERRYGAVSPRRTETNRRLYSAAEIARLCALQRAVSQGHTISAIANLSDDEILALLGDYAPNGPVRQSENLLNACKQAVQEMDTSGLMQLLESGMVRFSQQGLLNELIIPLVHDIGEKWQKGELRIAHEHLALGTIRTFLGNMLRNASTQANGPVVVAGTLSGQGHEIGALIVSWLAASQGWRPAYLGPSLPAEELVATAKQLSARLIALSFVYPGASTRTVAQIEQLGRLSEQFSIPFIAGGRAVICYAGSIRAAGGIVMAEFSEFRAYLGENT